MASEIEPSGGARMAEAAHSNLYVRNLTPDVDETLLHQLFSPFGQIDSCRIVKNARTHTSKGYGFVKYSSVSAAQEAIKHLNGSACGSSILEVKFADADAGRQGSGQVPGDNLYIRNIPSNWTEQDLVQLFAPFGSVQDCRLLQGGDASRGVGALVRMSGTEEATAAIEALNNRVPTGGATLQLLVRYADTAEEKRAKRANTAAASSYRGETGMHGRSDTPLPAGFTAFSTPGDPTVMHRGLLAAPTHPAAMAGPHAGHPHLAEGPHAGFGNGMGGPPHQAPHLLAAGLPMGPGAGPSSVYIKNLPPEADKLFLYERFAPHGAIMSVKVLTDDATGQCKGVGFVNYAMPAGAMLAVQAMNGVRVGEKFLHVSLQTHSRMRGPVH